MMNDKQKILTWKLSVPCSLLIIALLLGNIFSSHLYAQNPAVLFATEPDECILYNANNQKMYYYYLLNPAESMNFSVSNLDSLVIFSRAFASDEENNISYNYVISSEAFQDTVSKKCRFSNITRGVDGQFMSTYNKSILQVDQNSSITIKNISDTPVAFKLDDNTPNNFSSQLEYIAYSPDVYSDEKVLIVKDTEYTYYESDNGIIELDLFGPVYLKIISRTIFHNPATRKMDYQFFVYDNNELMATFTEAAHQSSQSIFPHDIEQIPSTGDVNILQFDKGSHNIQIRDNTNNHSMIFRLYINKTAVYVGDK